MLGLVLRELDDDDDRDPYVRLVDTLRAAVSESLMVAETDGEYVSVGIGATDIEIEVPVLVYESVGIISKDAVAEKVDADQEVDLVSAVTESLAETVAER